MLDPSDEGKHSAKPHDSNADPGGGGRPLHGEQQSQEKTEKSVRQLIQLLEQGNAGESSKTPVSATNTATVKEAEVVRIPALPTVPQFRAWKLSVCEEIAGASGKPDDGFA